MRLLSPILMSIAFVAIGSVVSYGANANVIEEIDADNEELPDLQPSISFNYHSQVRREAEETTQVTASLHGSEPIGLVIPTQVVPATFIPKFNVTR